ncbi:hypothetical protein [Hymenobacter latericus]|uniref:hypothetical protein n=1 Tax=Hymenobacter sp. YIM 151858-1 TaxID=2987688 RepID=UPI002227E265|nr:hypothetical protein [Hymenobacter sp. YIM 151858-1]UYZ61238.1 hypothetical protein OIS50_19910 [Hymenobacter sp. YIM 151858-1]
MLRVWVRALPFLCLLALGACSPSSAPSSPYANNLAISDAQGKPRDTTTFYFPAADSMPAPKAPRPEGVVLDGREENCAMELKMASHYLTYFEAPVLSNFYLGTPIYRLLWLRSFHRPVLLTLRRTATGATLRTQVLDKHPFFIELSARNPDELPADASPSERAAVKENYERLMADSAFQAQVAAGKRRAVQVRSAETTHSISLAQYQAFERLLAQAQFRQLPSCSPSWANDGARWTLEAHQAGAYHMVSRQNPDKKSGFRKACEYLIERSSVRAEERY